MTHVVDGATIRNIDALARLAIEKGLSLNESVQFESHDSSGEVRMASAVLCTSPQGGWVRITAYVQVVAGEDSADLPTGVKPGDDAQGFAHPESGGVSGPNEDRP